MLSTILSGKSYKPLGAPPTSLLRTEPSGTAIAMARDHSATEVSAKTLTYYPAVFDIVEFWCMQGAVATHRPETITLALIILGSFDFSGTVSTSTCAVGVISRC